MAVGAGGFDPGVSSHLFDIQISRIRLFTLIRASNNVESGWCVRNGSEAQSLVSRGKDISRSHVLAVDTATARRAARSLGPTDQYVTGRHCQYNNWKSNDGVHSSYLQIPW